MNRVFSIFMVIGALCAGSIAKAELVGSAWVGQPKISLDGKILCSPDPMDRPQWPPSSYSLPYLRIDRWNNGHFRIEEMDNCSSWFGFDSNGYVYQQRGSEVFDYWTGAKVGSISKNKIEINGGGHGNTKISKLIIELQSDGTLKFYAKFTKKNKPGSFEQWNSYSSYEP